MRAMTDRDRCRLAKSNRAYGLRTKPSHKIWQDPSIAPRDTDPEVQVRNETGEYALPVPCKLTQDGWILSRTGVRLVLPVIGWRVRGW